MSETPTSSPPPGAALTRGSYRINWLRYLRIVGFFGRLALQAILWYLVLQPIIGRPLVKLGESRRWRRWSRQFRRLSVRLGGVMIKLGQFVSARVDILPPEIIEELAGLQDEVPAAPFQQMTPTLYRELGADWQARFRGMDEIPVAAASLGQAYRAKLAANGDHVVIKVQRPGIESVVHTDLQALAVVARVAMHFGFIARRANLPLLLEEFARVLWEELDYTKEADNADRFAQMFAGDMGVYIPAIYREHSTRRVLVLEDVTAIKLNDYAALEAAGLDRPTIAQRLLDVYLRQIFVHRYFHADPHPGNIFIYPLPVEDTQRRQVSGAQRPFYIVFIDFGMTGQLTPELAAGLRETLIALITRDTRRLVHSYQQLGVLLPGADLPRIEEASQAVFDQVWGLNMSELAQVDYGVMRDLARDFSDLLFNMPFQVPQDFVYLGRAVGILSGMCTGLDPTFDPWFSIQPFVRTLLLEDNGGPGARSWLSLVDWDMLRALLTPETVDLAVSTGRDILTRAVALPARADNVLTTIERGELGVQMHADAHLDRHLIRIERAGRQIVLALVFGSLALSSTLLYIVGETGLGTAGYVLSGITLLVLLLRGRG